LKGLKFNSIHAPWIDIVYGDNEKTKKALDVISKVCKQIKARCVVFHEEQIEDYTPIINSDFLPAIENDDWRKPKHSVEDIKNILSQNPKFKFTFDFAHAITVSPLDVPIYINAFKDKLIEVHFSMANKEIGKHDFLYKYDNEEIRKLIQYLKNVSVPFVLEGVISGPEEIELIKREMEYIKLI